MDFVIFHICISKNSLYISWVVLPVKTQIYVFVYVSFFFFYISLTVYWVPHDQLVRETTKQQPQNYNYGLQ